jgi:hypothetical protein
MDYGLEPKFFLIGKIDHNDYSLTGQSELDRIAKEIGWQRPATHVYTSILDLLRDVKGWMNCEGVCIYSANDQAIHKSKADNYLKLHAFKSNATLENTVELFMEWGMPDYMDFEKQLIEKFDYECFDMVRSFISLICDAYKNVIQIESGMLTFVESLRVLPTRKEQAARVILSYGGEQNNRSGMVFHLLDGKVLTVDMKKKLLWQCLKK